MGLMNRMRENTKTILLILVFAFVLTIIFSWGMGGFKSGQPRGVIASVGNHEISYEEFYRLYQEELAAYRQQNGNDPEGYQLQQLQNRIYDNLVQQRLLADVVKEVNLDATDKEIIEEIYNNPPEELKQNQAFQDSSGQFDMNLYQAALDNPGAGTFWASVENYLRVTLPMRKLDGFLRASAIVTDDDAKLEYMKRNMKAEVDYLFYNAAAYQSDVATPGDAEIMEYYDEHKEDYKEPEKRVIDYVLLELKTTKADTQEVFAQAEELIEEARSGADFAELARIYSQDPGSAEKGGDLGFFEEGTMVKPFSDAAFAAEIGEIVGPVQTQYGVHIIKIEDKKQENDKQQVKARHILLKYEVSPKTRETLRDEASYLAEAAKEIPFEKVVEAEDLELQTSQPFTEGGFIPGIGMETRVSNFVFRSSVGKLSDIFYLDRGFLVLRVKEIQKEHVKPLDEVKESVVTSLKNQKSMEMAREKCQMTYDRINSGQSAEQLASDDSLTVKQTDQFDMTGNIPGVGREPRFVGTTFASEIGKWSAPIEGTRGYYLIKPTEKTEFNEENFENQKESLKNQVLQRKQQNMFGLWYTALKEKADIKDYRRDYF